MSVEEGVWRAWQSSPALLRVAGSHCFRVGEQPQMVEEGDCDDAVRIDFVRMENTECVGTSSRRRLYRSRCQFKVAAGSLRRAADIGAAILERFERCEIDGGDEQVLDFRLHREERKALKAGRWRLVQEYRLRVEARA